MKVIQTVDAVGHVLCQDLTQIIRGVSKGARFRKGHLVKAEDIPVLLSMGKENLYVWEDDDNMLHEDDAAKILYDICRSEGMDASEIKEGKIELRAQYAGLLKVDVQKLLRINEIEDVMIAARHNNTPVQAGAVLAGTRVIPLVIAKEKMEEVKRVGGGAPVLRLLPYQKFKVGVVTTGSEVYHHRIEDTFTPVLAAKLKAFGLSVDFHRVTEDDPQMTQEAIADLIAEGAELILCTGGMSVDPDDKTPLAIRSTGARIVTYGAPVLPGAMFLLAYHEGTGRKIPIMGLPGCVMYSPATIFDLILPRVLAGDEVTRGEICALGHGGLCLNCPICSFPDCGFGKGA